MISYLTWQFNCFMLIGVDIYLHRCGFTSTPQMSGKTWYGNGIAPFLWGVSSHSYIYKCDTPKKDWLNTDVKAIMTPL